MPTNPLQKLLETGAEFTEMSRQQAESVVKSLIEAGEVRRSEAEEAVQGLLDRGRQTALAFAELVQREVAEQSAGLAGRVDEIKSQLEALVSRVAGGAAAPAKKTTAKKAPAKKATTKKAATKKATTKKAPAKRKAPARRGRRGMPRPRKKAASPPA